LRGCVVSAGDLFTDDTAPSTTDRFEEFWKLYPSTRKTNKKGCREKWRAKRLDEKAATVLEDVRWRSKFHKPWLKDDGKYVPMPSTYLTQERWNDDREDIRDNRPKQRGEPAARLPIVARGALAMILKGYSRAVICETFGLTGDEYEVLENDPRSFTMPTLHPGDRQFVRRQP